MTLSVGGKHWCLKDEAEQVLTALDVDLANVQKMLEAADKWSKQE